MNGLMTIPDQFQYGETPQDPLQIMQSLMMQGQGPLQAAPAMPYQQKQTPVDIFNSILGKAPVQQGSPETSFMQTPSERAIMERQIERQELEKALAELEEEDRQRQAFAQNTQFMQSQMGKGMEYAQAPQVQATPLASLMAMAGGR